MNNLTQDFVVLELKKEKPIVLKLIFSDHDMITSSIMLRGENVKEQ